MKNNNSVFLYFMVSISFVLLAHFAWQARQREDEVYGHINRILDRELKLYDHIEALQDRCEKAETKLSVIEEWLDPPPRGRFATMA